MTFSTEKLPMSDSVKAMSLRDFRLDLEKNGARNVRFIQGGKRLPALPSLKMGEIGAFTISFGPYLKKKKNE